MLELCLVRQFQLPAELRRLVSHYFISPLTNKSIRDALKLHSRGRTKKMQQNRKKLQLAYGPIEWWDTSRVTDMSFLFSDNMYFNKDISNWDVSNVRYMENLFRHNICFNQPIGKWNVSRVISMHGMFSCAMSFNQPLNTWNVSANMSTQSMFHRAYCFNQPLDRWDVSNVRYMISMFEDAMLFNQPLSSWEPVKAMYLSRMFYAADSFHDPSVEKWKLPPRAKRRDMFTGTNPFFMNSNNKVYVNWIISFIVKVTVFCLTNYVLLSSSPKTSFRSMFASLFPTAGRTARNHH